VRTPNWIEFVLLSLGVYRLVRFAGYDDITARLRAWVTIPDRDYDGWIGLQHEAEQAGVAWDEFLAQHGWQAPAGFRWWLARLIRCPFCSAVWITVPIWLAWLWWPDGTVEVMVPLAIMAVASLTAKVLDP
jgi:hypothetical protein